MRGINKCCHVFGLIYFELIPKNHYVAVRSPIDHNHTPWPVSYAHSLQQYAQDASVPPLFCASQRDHSTPLPQVRQFTQSYLRPNLTRTAMKKSRTKSIVEEEEFEDEDTETSIEEEDLFASSSTPIIRDPSAHLQPLLSSLNQMIALPTTERHSAFSQTRVGALRRIVQLYPGEEIDGLKKVLRNWRFLGGRVTRKTAEEIVGRCCRLDRADLAVELVNDRTQCKLTLLLDTNGRSELTE